MKNKTNKSFKITVVLEELVFLGSGVCFVVQLGLSLFSDEYVKISSSLVIFYRQFDKIPEKYATITTP